MYLICMHLKQSSDQPKRLTTKSVESPCASEQQDLWKHTANGIWRVNESLEIGKQQVAGLPPHQMRNLH